MKQSVIAWFRNILIQLYDFSILLKDTVINFPKLLKNKKEIISEMYVIGTQAFLLVFFGGLFSGVILAIETGHNLEKFGATLLISRTVSLGTGAKNTSELGSMQLSEQVEALKAFGISPIEKLVVPRVIAALVMFLPLTFIADMTGIIGGMFITKTTFHVDLVYFWDTATKVLGYKDIFVGCIKPLFFSFFIATLSCYYGMITRGGTNNLGKNAIRSVVMSSVMVLTLDFIFTKVVWEIL